jgi:EVE domain
MMKYFIDLFSPETATAFEKSKRDVSGFRISQKTYVENQKIGPGDKFICYVTRLQRFVGVLEIKSKHFTDDTPIFQEDKDPFVLRFKVEPLVWLPLTKAIPIRQETVWNHLSFTKDLPDDSNRWTFMVFSSPRFWPKNDCKFLEKLLLDQAKTLVDYTFTEEDEKKLKSPKIRISGKKEVSVSIPDKEANTDVSDIGEERESIRVQAKLAEIGEKFGLKIWLPRNDRGKVQQFWKPKENVLLDELPFSFDEVTLRTIRNIDLLWVRRRTIVRAFEVEGTTSIYSGILRMADLLSLLPNIEINIHLVAPADRRNEVFKQISRPVFAVMEKGPLSELCSYISYDSIYELAKEKRLEYMTDSILDEYSEFGEE